MLLAAYLLAGALSASVQAAVSLRAAAVAPVQPGPGAAGAAPSALLPNSQGLSAFTPQLPVLPALAAPGVFTAPNFSPAEARSVAGSQAAIASPESARASAAVGFSRRADTSNSRSNSAQNSPGAQPHSATSVTGSPKRSRPDSGIGQAERIPATALGQAAAGAGPAKYETKSALRNGLSLLARKNADLSAGFDGSGARYNSAEPVQAAPEKPRKNPLRRALSVVLPLAGASVVTAAADIAYMDYYLHPLVRATGADWSEFQTTVFGVTLLKWWVFFIPFSTLLMAWAGWLAGRWRGALGGALMFFTGLEDALYYWLEARPLPASLPWLDANPFISWTRALTGTESVTGGGVLTSMTLGLGLGLALAFWGARRKRA